MSKQLVVVYGSLLSGLHNHGVMERARGELVGEGVSVENINMYSLGSYPSISLAHNSHEQPIKVEVYEVDNEYLHHIDSLEGYRGNNSQSFYNRSPIKVKMDDTEEVIEGLIYHIDQEQRVPVMTGDWRAFLPSRW